jgi:LysR family nitrogen assimilation transcriptional regulator
MIEFRQLRYFVAIVDAGSLTRASALLNIAQPSLSQQMADLEATIGAKLLDRSVRGVTATASGQAVYRHAQTILHLREQTADVARGAGNEIGGRVRLGLPSSIAMVLAAPLVKNLTQAFPDILLELYESPSTYLAAQLFDERVDLSLLVDSSPSPGLEVRALMEESIYFVQSAKTTSRKAKQAVRLADLTDFPMILTTRATTLRQLIDSACSVSATKLQVRAEASSIQTLLTVVAEGSLSTLVPYSALSWHPTTSALRLWPVSPTIARPVSLAWSRSSVMSPATECVRSAIIQVASELIHQGIWKGAFLAKHAENIKPSA